MGQGHFYLKTKDMEDLRLDIGCGRWKKTGFIGVDIDPESKADILHDVNKGLPFEDNTVVEIYCSHFLEHVQSAFCFIDEMHRVCKNGAKITIIIPMLDWIPAEHTQCFGPGWFHRNIDNNKFTVEHNRLYEKFVETPTSGHIYIFEKTLTLTVKK